MGSLREWRRWEGKWYVKRDWAGGVEGAEGDIVAAVNAMFEAQWFFDG